MGKLSHIEDIEARNERESSPHAAQERTAQAEVPVAQTSSAPETPARETPAQAPRAQTEPATSAAETRREPAARSVAQQEEDFHGISTVESFDFGHTALIVVAAIVFAGVILYVLNYWFHFI